MIDFTAHYKGNIFNDKYVDMKSVKGIPDYKNKLKLNLERDSPYKGISEFKQKIKVPSI